MRSVARCFFDAVDAGGSDAFLMLVSDTAERYGVAARTITYTEAGRIVTSLGSAYRRRFEAARMPERVALGLGNRPEFFYHWVALNMLGISVVPLNPQWQSAELEYVLDHSEAALAVVLPGEEDEIARRVEVATPDDFELDGDREPVFLGGPGTESALLYTSGTTGRPKGCMLSNEYFVSTGEWYRDVGGLCALRPGEDRLITPLPMYHMNAMAASTMAMILTGSCIVPIDRFHPSTWWRSVAECDATIMHYLGVMPAMLMGRPPTPRETDHNIRFGFGAGLSGELHTGFEKRFGMQLIEAWAMTETGCTVAVIASEEPRKVGTACFGRPPTHMDWRLIDDHGEDVPPGAPGELLVRRYGDNPRQGFFSGYLKDEAATSAAWEGGYFHTGDLVYMDEDGLMHFVDRKKNVIRRSGENISAVEVEEVILELDSVLAVGVAAVPDEIRGDEVFASIVPQSPDADPQTIAQEAVNHCLRRLAYFKAPGFVAIVEALPLTATEKVQRAELKARSRQLVETGACVDTRDKKRRG